MPAPTLFTVGYEGRTLAEVAALLRQAKVDLLIDVREVAWSHKPGFAKKALAEGLPKEGVAYVHAPFVGNPSKLRKSGASLSRILAGYERHLDQSSELEARFDELVREAHTAGRQVAVMCFERDPAECHRGVLARRWGSRHGGRVVHLGVEQMQIEGLD
jgi:uncharacterized protein (DUF488 family)